MHVWMNEWEDAPCKLRHMCKQCSAPAASETRRKWCRSSLPTTQSSSTALPSLPACTASAIGTGYHPSTKTSQPTAKKSGRVERERRTPCGEEHPKESIHPTVQLSSSAVGLPLRVPFRTESHQQICSHPFSQLE